MISALLRLFRRTDAPRSRSRWDHPRLLPADAYYGLDEQSRDRVDARLRADLATIPTAPGEYFDRESDRWTLHESGAWSDRFGNTRAVEYAPLMSMFGPFTDTPSIYPRSRGRKDSHDRLAADAPRRHHG